jgi:hypothetical protein
VYGDAEQEIVWAKKKPPSLAVFLDFAGISLLREPAALHRL